MLHYHLEVARIFDSGLALKPPPSNDNELFLIEDLYSFVKAIATAAIISEYQQQQIALSPQLLRTAGPAGQTAA